MISLTPAEREKFALYCEQQAKAQNDMLPAMKAANTPEALIKRFRAEAMALSVVSLILRNTHEESI